MSKPLSQLKILDFSTLLPGPYASMLMADMGAEILRVEAIDRHDLVKSFKPSINGNSYAFLTLNRNKKAIALDLKKPAAVEIVKKLISEYDILLEQFRPGVMAKLGLDYQTLKAINPKLIYCSITGYGQNGCYKDRAGHDINYLALSGLASFSGTEATGPVLSGTQIADIAGGSHHAVMGIMAAAFQRLSTGQGQHIDISMTDAAFALTGMFGAGGVGAGDDPQLGGTLLNGGSFYGYYQTKDNRYLSVGSLEPKFAKIFFTEIGQADWYRRSHSSDVQEQAQLKVDISSIISEQSLNYWTDKFALLDTCIEPVLSVSEAQNSPLMRDRNMVIEVKTPSGEFVKQIAPAIKFTQMTNEEFPEENYIFTPNKENTQTLLKRFSYSQQDINSLVAENVIK